jgi:hypothetical protein
MWAETHVGVWFIVSVVLVGFLPKLELVEMITLSSVLGFTCGRTGLATGMILIPRFEVLSLVLLKM